MNFCTSCGTRLETQVNFCTSCGQPLSNASTNSSAADLGIQDSNEVTDQVASWTPKKPARLKQSQPSAIRKWLIGLLAVAIAIAIGYVGYRDGAINTAHATSELATPQPTFSPLASETPMDHLSTDTPTIGLPSSSETAASTSTDNDHFMSPKQNIFCEWQEDNYGVRCDFEVYKGKTDFPSDSDCSEWSGYVSFIIPPDGIPYMDCFPETIIDHSWPTLPYNKEATRSGVTCVLNTKEMFCSNDSGNELHVNRNRYTVS